MYNRGQMHLPQLSKLNKIIIIITVSLFLINSIFIHAINIDLKFILGLSSFYFFKGYIYQIVSYSFVANGLLELVFNSLIFWFIGSELETLWGKTRYRNFLLSAVIGGGLIFLLFQSMFFSDGPSLSISLSGLGGAANAMLLAYAIIYPDRMLILLLFPVKAKYFCAILIAMQLYSGFFSPMAVLSWGHLGTMLSGFIFMIMVSSPRFKQYFDHEKISSLFSKKKKRGGKANLTLIKTDKNDDEGPKYH